MEQTKELKEIMEKLGAFVRSEREKQGLTQTELCTKVNELNPNIAIDKFYLSKLENYNLDGLRLETLSSIVAALDGNVVFSYKE